MRVGAGRAVVMVDRHASRLADNARWVLGMFYIDRGDLSIMVEKRNRVAVLIVVTSLLLTLSLAALGLVGLIN